MLLQVLRSQEASARRQLFIGAVFLISWCGGLYDPVNHIESARLYGNIDHYAYWFVDLLVGTPPQRASVIIDTGSGLAAFPCAGCPHCGRHIDANFDFQKSKTAKWMPCGKGCPGSCKQGHCGYRQGYQEGSSISGYWFKDWVRLGDAIQRNPPVYTSIGCHQNENKLFYTQKANGILGIRGSDTLFRALFKDREHVNSDVFSMCLAEWGGRLVVGGFNQSYHSGAVQWIPLARDSYVVTLSGMQVPGESRFSNFGRTMVDSGTTYTYMGSKPYQDLRRTIESYCAKNGGCRATRQGTCWTARAGLQHFPKVDVYFGNVKTYWEPRSYLYRKGKTQLFCYSFENDGPGAGTVLGASWMLYHEVIFDLQRNRLGIAPANCPEYRERPAHSIVNLDPPTAPPPTMHPLPGTPSVTVAQVTVASTSVPASVGGSGKVGVLTSTPLPSSSVTIASTSVPASVGGSGKVGVLTSTPLPSSSVSSATDPPLPTPTYIYRSEYFTGSAKTGAAAGVVALALAGLVCCLCRARARGAEINSSKYDVVPQVVGTGETVVDDEEINALANGRAKDDSSMEF